MTSMITDRRRSVQLDHRMEQGAHRDPGLGQGAHDAVDQEGRVGLDDADQVVVQRLAVGAGQRPDRDQGRRTDRIIHRRAPGGRQERGKVLAVQFGRFVGRIIVVRLSQEGLFGSAGVGADNPRE
jgi:hypothetical protein